MSFGARFLSAPDRFPPGDDGEPWGDGAVALDLPGGPYRFLDLSAAQVAAVHRTFPGAVVNAEVAAPPAGPPLTVRLRRAAAADFLPVDTRGWDYSMDFAWEPARVRLAGLGLAGRLDWQPALAGTLWTCEDGGVSFPGIFENFFRVLAAYRVQELGGAILHCAGIVRDGRAYLFLGRSGAGKTTVSRLSLAAGLEVLSDDLNVLWPLAPSGPPPAPPGPLAPPDLSLAPPTPAPAPLRLAVRQLPFTGDFGDRSLPAPSAHPQSDSAQPDSAQPDSPHPAEHRGERPPVPLAALLRLEKSDSDSRTPLSRAETLACLVACAPFVNVDPFRRELLEDRLAHLLAAAAPPAYALRFSLGGGLWSILA